MKKIKRKNDKNLLKQLFDVDPQLTPKELSSLFPSYQKFLPIKKSHGLWIPKKRMDHLTANSGKYKKIMLLMSGISASGKDFIRENIQKMEPKLLFKAVTATTREIRNNEENEKNYYFYDKDKFIQEANKDRFIEHTNFGNNLYGSPKRSFDDALLRSEPVVCSHVEMQDGWPGVEKYFEEEYSGEKPFILKIFTMPNMKFSKYATKWLPQIREDWDNRLSIAAWEISAAADRADIILTSDIFRDNPELLTNLSQEIIDLSENILRSNSS